MITCRHVKATRQIPVPMLGDSNKMSGPPEILTCTLGALPADVQPGTAPLLHLVPADDTRPYVTLTFAQSIDAKIAGAGGKQLIISGEESMKMTHW
jgi:2,5-diamino-6-(ribosylamino)-4(3H)-pyrimidinone 5'-phosphate reductase